MVLYKISNKSTKLNLQGDINLSPAEIGVLIEKYIHFKLQTKSGQLIDYNTIFSNINVIDSFVESNIKKLKNTKADVELQFIIDSQHRILGHPDLIDMQRHIIYDVKTTSWFKKMKH